MIRASSALAFASLLAVGGAAAQPISMRDSFPIGSGPGIVCSAQTAPTDRALSDMFDRGYAIVCRDAAGPVGRLYALRRRGGDPAARLAALRAADCGAPERAEVEGLGPVEVLSCRASGAPYRVYFVRRGNTLYAAEGLAGYDSALLLGLRSVIADAPVEGQVEVATTGAGDAAAFARAQAAALDPRRALEEGYRRNNAGSYAEASEFFAVLSGAGEDGTSRAEALLNQALQRSNLGRHDEAAALFAQAEPLVADDPVLARRLRNYRAMHLMNLLRPADAVAELDRPLPAGARGLPPAQAVDATLAARLDRDSLAFGRLDAAGTGVLLPEEKVAILDAQALHLRGTIFRIEGRFGEGAPPLEEALTRLAAVRDGRVASTLWMRSQILGELAAVAEARGDAAAAEARHREAIGLVAAGYPGSPALQAAQARLAGFYVRAGRDDEARALYRDIVEANVAAGTGAPGLRRALAPYFALLASDGASPQAVADLFRASQTLLRPGVAQTQAVLARELSGGSDEAARLFRQAVSLGREVERTRVEIGRAEAEPARVEALRAVLERLERDQAATQARLAEFPRYRAVSTDTMSLDALRALLRPGEAYYKMLAVGDAAYAVFATPEGARAWRIEASPAALEADVDALRETIATVEDGRTVTYPFDVARAHALYRTLFAPVASEMAAVRHLVFEPDGALLRLPPNLLVTDAAGIAAYDARAAAPGADGFDFTGIAWLGRDREISTAVSAASFRDVRRIAPSRAEREYIGFGQNEPAAAFFEPPAAARAAGPARDCSLSPAAWGRPISAEELFTASRALAAGQPGEADVVTGAAFTDSAIKARDDLASYRVMHFATHGLIRPPRPDCPPRPALLTSFGGEGSDGLLTFAEIFDLRIDADLVILSACDTAARAGATATEEAGLSSGGDFALDGLVRAFVGAGGRSVVASHWPVPDDFDATNRLISGLFEAPPGTSTAAALARAQRALMDDPLTSHPYYWSGFAIVGDGARPVVPVGGGAGAARAPN